MRQRQDIYSFDFCIFFRIESKSIGMDKTNMYFKSNRKLILDLSIQCEYKCVCVWLEHLTHFRTTNSTATKHVHISEMCVCFSRKISVCSVCCPRFFCCLSLDLIAFVTFHVSLSSLLDLVLTVSMGEEKLNTTCTFVVYTSDTNTTPSNERK